MLPQFFGPIVPQCTGLSLAGTTERLCTVCDLLVLIDNLVKFTATIAPLVAVIFIVWGSFIIITAGSTDRYAKGRDVIKFAVIGLAIVLAAWVIVSTVFLVLTGSYGGPLPLPWHRIQC